MSTRRRKLFGWLAFLLGCAFFGGTSGLSAYATGSGDPANEISDVITRPGAIYLATEDYGTACVFTGPGSSSLANKNTGILPRSDWALVRVVRIEVTAPVTVRCTSGTATVTRGFITRLYPLGENEFVIFGYFVVMVAGMTLIRGPGPWRANPPWPWRPEPPANRVRLSTGGVRQ